MADMGRHPEAHEARRAPVTTRPRYGRIVAAGSATLITLVAVLAGIGVLPSGAVAVGPSGSHRAAATSADGAVELSDSGTRPTAGSTPGPSSTGTGAPPSSAKPKVEPDRAPDVPAASGTGRRVVFDISDQRVWLVTPKAGKDVAVRTYLVSGSVTDNLRPGTYSVYSRSLSAWGVDDSGSMRYMVRFAHGARAAIGFHDIPVLDGRPVQTRAELGTPHSHGCIRQWRPDARALWRFAPLGTKVVVTA